MIRTWCFCYDLLRWANIDICLTDIHIYVYVYIYIYVSIHLFFYPSRIFLLRKFGIVWVFIDVSPDLIPPGTYSCLSTFPLFIIIHLSINPFKVSFLLSRKHAPFCCNRCWQPPLHSTGWSGVQERTREHQSGHQSSYWLWTSVLNFSDLSRTGVTVSPLPCFCILDLFCFPASCFCKIDFFLFSRHLVSVD